MSSGRRGEEVRVNRGWMGMEVREGTWCGEE